METLQILSLKPALVKDQKELNVYVNLAQDFKKELQKIEVVNKDNYEVAKNIRSDITKYKTKIEESRKMLKRPLLDLGKAIDERARELAKPFIEMQEEIKARISEYEKEENERKEKEQKRIQGIIEKIESFEDLEELTKYYKSLEQKDQRKKAIAEAGVLQKEKIIEKQKENAKAELVKKIQDAKDLLELDNIDLGEFKEDLEIVLQNRRNAIKLAELEKEQEKERQKQKEVNDFLEKIKNLSLKELEKIEVPENVLCNQVNNFIEKRILELRNKVLEEKQKKAEIEADNKLLVLLKEKVEKENNLENLKEYGGEVLKLKLNKNQRELSLAIQEKIKKLEELEDKKRFEMIQDFLEKNGYSEEEHKNYYIETTEDFVNVYKLVDTLVFNKKENARK